LDVTARLRDDPGVLARGLTDEQARRMIGTLSQAGIPAFAIPESSRVTFPEPVLLETAKLAPESLDVEDLRDADNRQLGAVSVPYRDIVFLAAAQVKVEEERRVVEGGDSFPGRPASQGRVSGVGAYALGIGPMYDDGDPELQVSRSVRHERKTEIHHYLDVYAVEPAHHLRLPASTFNFVLTGLKMRPTSILNLVEFIRSFVPRCTGAHVDPGVRRIVDGDPLTNLKINGMDIYERYLDWRIQLLYHPPAE
jgi:hypothetical protein